MIMNTLNPKLSLITHGAVIAALYAALTVVFAPISFGMMQVRIAEVLTILPMFTPAAVPGLFIGCIIANLFGGAAVPDIIFGSIATLIGALGSRMLRKNRWLVPLPPIAANTVIVPFVLRYAYGVEGALPVLAMFVAAGEIISCYLLGELLISGLLHMNGIKPPQ